MTRKLYYEDLYMKEFDASVLTIREKNGKYHVALDRTAFYPGGGGQPCDMGKVGTENVTEVYERDGVIYHVLVDKPATEIVHCQIDWEFRFDLMQQHLGQHILSAVLVQDYEADTVSLRMGRELTFIDINKTLNPFQIEEAGRMANQILYDNIPVEPLYPDIEEIRRCAKREIPQTKEAIRIVRIGTLDYTPCCGTHNKSTGEVGSINITHTEQTKSGTRIYFNCGRTALIYNRDIHGYWKAVTEELSCEDAKAAESIGKMKADLEKERASCHHQLARLVEMEAEQLREKAFDIGGTSVISQVVETDSADELKQLFRLLTEEKDTVVILGGKLSGTALLMAGSHASQKGTDVRQPFKAAIALISGRGGGSPAFCQGMGTDSDKLNEAVTIVCDAVKEQLS